LHVSLTAEDAAVSAARDLTKCIAQAVQTRGTCALALSGGHSATLLLAALARAEIDWSAVHIFQVDERVAAKGSSARNATDLQTELLGRTGIPAANIHLMPVDAPELTYAARQYTEVLEAVTGNPPVLDIVHLGLGADGHTASLVPGDRVLEDRSNDVAMTGEYQGYRRLTLTYPCLQRARQIIWFVTGAEKAMALGKLAANNTSIPAGRICHAHSRAYVDSAAAEQASAITSKR